MPERDVWKNFPAPEFVTPAGNHYSCSISDYQPGSFEREIRFLYGGVGDGDKTFSEDEPFSASAGNAVGIGFTPAVVKDSYKEFFMQIKYKWGRK